MSISSIWCDRKPPNCTGNGPPVKKSRRPATRARRPRVLGVREPAEAGLLVAEPGHLALGEAHRGGDDLELGLRLRSLAADDRHRLAVADRLQRPGVGGHPGGEEAADLVDEPVGQHAARTGRHRVAQPRPVRGEADEEGAEARERRAAPAVLLADRPARAEVDLEGADHADAVARRDAPGGGGVDAGEQPVQARVAAAGGDPLEARAEGLVARRALEEAVEQGAEVEARPPGHDREPPAGPDVVEGEPGRPRELGGRVALARVGDVEQVVRDRGALGRARLRGPQVEPAIDLLAVAGDDLAAALAREAQRESRLAGRGRPGDDDQRSVRSRHSAIRSAAARRITAPRTCCAVGPRLTAAGGARARSRSRGPRRGCA
ncbi:MAG: hypothetical protein U0599_03665 [Vicinamibacteria bacterium]